MTISDKIREAQQRCHSTLCVGLDSTVEKLPEGFEKNLDSLVRFNELIIEATKDFCCAYKINFGFYERYGSLGYAALEKTRERIPSSHVSIADAKRGDIGNTAESYAVAILKTLDFDSVTVNPYMGHDTVAPFLSYENKLVFVLALTSNEGSADFQYLQLDGQPLYRRVMEKTLQWPSNALCGFVVGATHPSELADLRKDFPHVPFLIPGVGSQGASAEEIHKANAGGVAFVNSSRAILYASSKNDFAERAADVARATAASLMIDT